MGGSGKEGRAVPSAEWVELFTGHFTGSDTVLHVLRREGYEVEHAPVGHLLTEPPSRPADLSIKKSEGLDPHSSAVLLTLH
ncbi:Metalloprotease TIKI1 [Manis javanica]|nr:Metalloprotease TIKI1 [Manis javanica]